MIFCSMKKALLQSLFFIIFVITVSYSEIVKEVKIKQDLITVFSTKSNEVIPKIFQESINLEMRISSLTLKQPTLDDVFISYTGHDLRDENENQKFSRRKEFNLNR